MFLNEEIHELSKEIDSLKIRLEEMERLLDDKVRQFQLTCKHEKTRYYPDPSGNNDSFHSCLDCGLEKKRF